MLTIGLTGGIGSGKSTAARFFKEQGVTVIDLDQIARELVTTGSPALAEIQERFGKEILDDKNHLDRQKLAQIIFFDANEKEWLEALLHPLIREEQQRQLDQATSGYAVIEIPLLTENKLSTTVDRVLLIDCPEATQKTRALARGVQSEQQIDRTIAAQATRKQRQQIADDIVLNDGSIENMLEQLQQLHQKYLQLAEQPKTS
ncbi:MAG: dephospho-CoA kinase [Pseudomonadales bacterium]